MGQTTYPSLQIAPVRNRNWIVINIYFDVWKLYSTCLVCYSWTSVVGLCFIQFVLVELDGGGGGGVQGEAVFD